MGLDCCTLFSEGTEFSIDDQCLVSLLRGLCLKHLGHQEEAEAYFTLVLCKWAPHTHSRAHSSFHNMIVEETYSFTIPYKFSNYLLSCFNPDLCCIFFLSVKHRSSLITTWFPMHCLSTGCCVWNKGGRRRASNYWRRPSECLGSYTTLLSLPIPLQ